MELYDIKLKNFCSYESLELPLYKQGLVWIGGENNDTAAADSNGSGKSTIFKAISWGLYGETIDGVNGDEIIRNGATSAVTEVRLTEDGKRFWTIKRMRTKGKPSLELINPTGKKVSGKRKTLQQDIIKLIGIDFKAFKNSVLYGQNDHERFANPKTKDIDRKNMLYDVLCMETFNACCEISRETAKALKKEVLKTETTLETKKDSLDENELNLLKESFVNFDAEKKRLIAEYKRKAALYKKKATNVLKIEHTEEIEEGSLREQLNKAISAFDKKTERRPDIESVVTEISAVLSKMEKIQVKLAIEKEKNRGLLKKQKTLSNDNCPVCKSDMNKGKAKNEFERVKNEIVNSNKIIDRHYSHLADLEKLYQENKRTKEIYEEYHRECASLESEVDKLTGQLEKLEVKNKAIRTQNQNAEAIAKVQAKNYVAQAKRELELAKLEKEKVNPYRKQIEITKKKLSEKKQEIKELEEELEQKRTSLAHALFWVKGFSGQGIPSFILDSVMPFLTSRSNHYLETLTDGDISVEIATQRELKSSKGALKDEITVNWVIEGNKNYPPSGGQLKKIEIAVDLALMDLVAETESGKLDILMLDEILDGLDAEGCGRVLKLLTMLRKSCSTIFVVSHESMVNEVFDRAIRVSKRDGISSVNG